MTTTAATEEPTKDAMNKLYAVTIALVALLLIAAKLPNINGYAIVDCDAPATGFAVYPTIQQALDNGARWVDVRDGVCSGFTVDTPHVTVNFQGAEIPNDGTDTSIAIDADYATLQGDYCITGKHNGGTNGDFYQGVGIKVNKAYATIDGLCTRNLRSFSVLVPEPTAHHVTVKACDLQNVATVDDGTVAPYAILFINGSSYNTVEDCDIGGHSQGVGLWYGTSYNVVRFNRLIDNYGRIEGGGKRSAFEDYGLPNAVNVGNTFEGNLVDGSTSSAFELADSLENTRVIGNTTHRTFSAFGIQGSDTNKANHVTIEGNTFHGDGNDGTNWVSGDDVRICHNTFDNWTTADIGTIFLPGDALGNVDICHNTFDGGGLTMRITSPYGVLHFSDNAIRGGGGIHIDSGASPRTVIENNVFSGTSGRMVNAVNTAVTVRDNYIEGSLFAGAGSTVEGNEIHTANASPANASVYPRANSVYRNNRIYSDFPSWDEWSVNGLLAERNYAESATGGAVSLFACNANSTCVGNWTFGQVP